MRFFWVKWVRSGAREESGGWRFSAGAGREARKSLAGGARSWRAFLGRAALVFGAGLSAAAVLGGARRGRQAHRLGLELGARLDLDFPAAQAARQAHVLALLADRQRLLVVVHDHRGRARIDVGVDVLDVD